MGIHGCLGVYGCDGCRWGFMDVYATLWVYMGVYGCLGVYWFLRMS